MPLSTASKFNPNYVLDVQYDGSGNYLSVKFPLTLELDITRNALSSQNVAQFRIYNLSKTHQDALRYTPNDYGKFRAVRLHAGYGNDNLPMLFLGNIQNAWTVREGVDMVTQIEIYDGGFDFSTTEAAIQSGANESQKQLLKRLVNSFAYVKAGTVGNYDNTPRGRSASYSGRVADILRQLTGNGFFVDAEVAHCLKDNEYLAKAGPIKVINASTGLLNAPIIQGTRGNLRAEFDMIFEPTLAPGQAVFIDAPFTGTQYKGIWKVLGVKHRGVISGAVGKSVITTRTFWFSSALKPAGGL